MIIYFCSDCGAYSVGPASNCEECQAELPDDNWTEINDEEFQQLGCVDISSEPYESTDEVQESQETR